MTHAVAVFGGEGDDVNVLRGVFKLSTEFDDRVDGGVVRRGLIGTTASTGSVPDGDGVGGPWEELDVAPQGLARGAARPAVHARRRYGVDEYARRGRVAILDSVPSQFVEVDHDS